MEDLPFDAVVLNQGGKQSQLSAEAFLRLPLPERVRLILGRHVEFLKREEVVDRGVALKSLMDAARSGG
jgi:hypothetical protein